MIWPTRSVIKRGNVVQQRGVVLMVVPIVIAGGIGIIVGVTLAQYAYKTMKRMKEEEGGVAKGPKVVNGLQSIGIDIGAVYTKMAAASNSTTTLLEHRDGSYIAPSYVFYDHDDISVGKLAYQKRFTQSASVFHLLHFVLGQPPATLAKSLHINGPESLEYHRNGHAISPVVHYKHLINDVLRNVEAKTPIEDAHFTFSHPHFLTSQQLHSMKSTFAEISKASASFVPDHIAVLQYMQPVLHHGSSYAIIDIGSHFTQFTVTTYNSSSPLASEVKYTDTDFSLGGALLSDLLVEHIAAKFEAQHSIKLLQDTLSKQRLYDAIEPAVQELSTKHNTRVYIPYLTALADGGVQDLDIEVSRRTLEELSVELANNYKNALEKLQNTSFDGVILVGGGAQIPWIRQLTADLLKVEPMLVEKPQHAVALGAASCQVEERVNDSA